MLGPVLVEPVREVDKNTVAEHASLVVLRTRFYSFYPNICVEDTDDFINWNSNMTLVNLNENMIVSEYHICKTFSCHDYQCDAILLREATKLIKVGQQCISSYFPKLA